MKNTLTSLLLALAVAASAQQISTNYTATNYVAASSYGSALFTGASNDMRFFRTVTWVMQFQGEGMDSSGVMSIYFGDAYDRYNTEFLTQTNYALTATADGTNRVTATLTLTNYPFTFQTPARYSNTVANALTNFGLWSITKYYLKDQ